MTIADFFCAHPYVSLFLFFWLCNAIEKAGNKRRPL